MSFEIVILPHTFGMKNPSDFIFVPLMVDSLVRSNPDSKITFINPNSFELDNLAIDNFYYEDGDIDGIAELINLYVHLSTNAANFELFCIKRFFILRHFMRVREIKRCFVVETDILFFESLGLAFDCLDNADTIYLSDKKCISSALVSYEFIDNFCNGVLNLYGSQQLLQKLTNWYEKYNQSGAKGGVCDMTFCEFAGRGDYGFKSFSIFDFSEVRHYRESHFAFDSFIGRSKHSGESREFVMSTSPFDNKVIKSITFSDGSVFSSLVNGEKVKFGSLHFQGSAKLLMGLYFTKWLESKGSK